MPMFAPSLARVSWGTESGLTVGCCLIQSKVHDGDTDSMRGVGTRVDVLLDLVGRECLTAVEGSQDARRLTGAEPEPSKQCFAGYYHQAQIACAALCCFESH
jgi:hypothetical protein